MNLAVKFYKDEVEKPEGIPDTWPSQVIELGEGTKLPDNTWQLMLEQEYLQYLDANRPQYDAWVRSQTHETVHRIVSEKIEQAATFGDKIIEQVEVENVLLGITQEGKTKLVFDYCANLQVYLTTGSLYAAITELDLLIAAGVPEDLAPYITADRLNQYKLKIQGFLGI